MRRQRHTASKHADQVPAHVMPRLQFRDLRPWPLASWGRTRLNSTLSGMTRLIQRCLRSAHVRMAQLNSNIAMLASFALKLRTLSLRSVAAQRWRCCSRQARLDAAIGTALAARIRTPRALLTYCIRALAIMGRAHQLVSAAVSLSRSERGQDRALVLLFDKGLHFRAGQCLGQLLHARVVLVVCACHQEVHVWRLLAFDRQRIACRV